MLTEMSEPGGGEVLKRWDGSLENEGRIKNPVEPRSADQKLKVVAQGIIRSSFRKCNGLMSDMEGDLQHSGIMRAFRKVQSAAVGCSR